MKAPRNPFVRTIGASAATPAQTRSLDRAGSRTPKLIGALVLLATLIAGVSLAWADKGVVAFFGNASGTSSDPGGLNQPRDIAVNVGGLGGAAAGDIYVANANNNRIEVYDSDHEFKFNFGSNGTDAGNLAAPTGIAIDQTDGSVYVREQGNRRVSKFEADGTFLFAFGAGVADNPTPGPQTDALQTCTATCFAGLNSVVNGGFGTSFATPTLEVIPDGAPNAGDLIVTDPGAATNRRIQRISAPGNSGPATFEDAVGGSQGAGDTQFGNNSPNRVAIDDAGFVYVVDVGNNRVQRFDSNLDFDTTFAAAELSGTPAATEIAIDPGAVSAGDATDDRIHVVKPCTALLCPGASLATERRIKELDTTGTLQATHLINAGIGVIQGLGIDTTEDRLFASSTTGGHRVYVVDETVAPDAVLDPITVFNAHTATFSGTVDPNGSPTDYRFEYVDDAEHGVNGFTNAVTAPTSDVDLGNGDSAEVVSQDVVGLDASTTYHVRLIGEQIFGPSNSIGGPDTFTTDAKEPTINGTSATVGEDEANLRASLNPENEPTDYFFEWGTDQSYGNTTAVDSLPQGTDPVVVSEDLSGLTTGQTYHFRLVAENNTGETLGPDRTFTPQAKQSPATGRAYEVASHYPTGGVPINPNQALVAPSEDGDKVVFGSRAPLPGSVLFPPEDQTTGAARTWLRYFSSRGADAWNVAETGFAGQSASPADGSRLLTKTIVSVDPDDQGVGNGEDLYQVQPDGSLEWITRDPRIPAGTPQNGGASPVISPVSAAMMSVDGRTVVFTSQRQLSDDDTTAGSFDPDRQYKWDDGDLSFIGKRPDGSVPANGSWLGTAYSSGGAQYGAVSRDGSRVVFSAQRLDGSAGRGIYVQSDGQPTVEATKETGVAPLPAAQPFPAAQFGGNNDNTVFRGASADASRIFYTSSSRLTADSGAQATQGGDADLYVYDIDADKVRNLTPQLGPDPDGTASHRADVQGLAANSEDGKRVYFVAESAYPGADPAPNGDTPVDNQKNLYLAELDGIDDAIDLKFIGALGNADSRVWQTYLLGGEKTSYASPDGSVLGFGSSQDDLTDDVKDDDLNGTRQLYVYNADAHSLDCASCPSDGSLPASDVNPELSDGGLSGEGYWQQTESVKRWVSSSGQVFFTTFDSLVDGDVNTVTDVYEYQDGQLSLVSAGTGGNGSRLENASRNGDAVFFVTTDALASQDNEPGIPKLYAARVGNGFPVPTSPAPCEGDECKDDVPEAPGDDDTSTDNPTSGNPEGIDREACQALESKAAKADARSSKLKQKSKKLRKKAKRAGGKKAKRLQRKAKQKTKTSRKQAKRATGFDRQATKCRGGSQ